MAFFFSSKGLGLDWLVCFNTKSLGGTGNKRFPLKMQRRKDPRQIWIYSMPPVFTTTLLMWQHAD